MTRREDATDEEPQLVYALHQGNGPRNGRPIAFVSAALTVIVWALTGPLFGFSDTWQLVINTSTTIVTFLMVFLIQATQNRDAEAMQVKLDEIIRAIGNAKNELLDIEELEEADLDGIRKTYEEIAEKRAANTLANRHRLRLALANVPAHSDSPRGRKCDRRRADRLRGFSPLESRLRVSSGRCAWQPPPVTRPVFGGPWPAGRNRANMPANCGCDLFL